MRWVRHVALIGEMRNACNLSVGKHEGNRSLGKPRRTWENNIRMNLRAIMWEGVDWMHLAQDREYWQTLVCKVINLWVP
jgi:hypothetical protein